MLGASWLDLFYHELQCLVAAWTLEVLCIYVLRSQKGLARYHYCRIISWLFWQRVAVWDTLLSLVSWLCHWYEPLWSLRVIVDMVSYNVGWKHACCLSLFMQTRAKEFVKVFLFHFQFINWIAWGQASYYKWGASRDLIRLQRIYNFWLLHAILSTVLGNIGLYFPLLYYFWD